MGEKRRAYRVLVTTSEGKRSLGRRRWGNNIKMDLRETGWVCMDWIHLVQDRDDWRVFVNTVMNLRVP
jgi:superfamily II RNA helicase